MTEKKPFYITTPIYYVNGSPHMGHAYCTVACDVMARFKRLDGYNVHFLTGTDEHGIKVLQSARDQNIAPQQLCDDVAQQFKAVLPLMNIQNDDFIRTTEPRHKHGAQVLWKALQDAGQIYKSTYSGWYAVRDEAYYDEDELTTAADGSKTAPSGAPVTWMEEESYFFKLSEWGDKLLELYDNQPDFIQPESSRREIVSFVKSGLKDLSISRTTFDWGVPVPGDEKHVMYVWLDALSNYITALGYGSDDDALFQKFWPADAHVVGKEITRFHAIYWPAFLMAANIPLPKKIVATGWWVAEGQKMSKSLGNVLVPSDLVQKYGVDGTRFALLAMVSFGSDGNFAHDRAVDTINAFCANSLGNLAQRTLSFIAKNCGGFVPSHRHPVEGRDPRQEKDVDAGLRQHDELVEHMNAFAFDKYLAAIKADLDYWNQYVDKNAPWTLRKEGKIEEMEAVLYNICEGLRVIGILLWPFMPTTMDKLLDQLAVPKEERTFAHLTADYALKPAAPLPTPEGLFPRLEA